MEDKYEIDEAFYRFKNVKMPVYKAVIPFMQKVMDDFPCTSDEKVKVEKGSITSYDGEKVRVLVIKPWEIEEKAACMIYYHGGGFMFKASPHHYSAAKRYAAEAGCKVIMVDYRLAPRHKFPCAPEDCFAVYKWVVTYAEQLHIDPERLVVAGDSAGGNLATVVSLMARDRRIRTPALQMMIYPVTDRRMEYPSEEEYTDTPVWNSELNTKMWRYYLGEEEEIAELAHIEYASPMEAESLEGLPPAYIEVAEFDCLRDEAVAYAERLEAAGIPVTLHRTKGTIHGYDNAEESEIVEECFRKRIQALKNL